MVVALQAASVVGYTRLDRAKGACFLLPLLRANEDPNWYIQETGEAGDLVKAFAVLDKGDTFDVGSIAVPLRVQVGDPVIHAFSDGNAIHVGTSKDLESQLRIFATDSPEDPAINLQIYCLIGSRSERREARTRMEEAIRARYGNDSAMSFYRDALSSAFWSGIVTAWKLEHDPGRLRALRATARVSAGETGVRVENVKPAGSEEAKQLLQLRDELTAEFARNEYWQEQRSESAEPPQLSLAGLNTRGDEKSETFITNSVGDLPDIFVNTAMPALLEKARGLLQKAIALEHIKQYQDAVVVYNQIIEQFSDFRDAGVTAVFARALERKGYALLELGNFFEADAFFSEIIKRYDGAKDPALQAGIAAILIARCLAFDYNSQGSNAIAACDGILVRFETSRESALQKFIAQALTNKGAVLSKMGRPEQGLRFLKAAILRFRASEDPQIQECMRITLSNYDAIRGKIRNRRRVPH